MKGIKASTITGLLHDLLNGSDAQEVLVSTYTLDESEAWRMAYSLRLTYDAKIVLRYDPSGFRRWGETRLIQSRWLKPFQPNPARRRGRGRIPPIYHPKIVLAESGEKCAVVVSTANLAVSDQAEATNLHVGLLLPSNEARKVREWVLARTPQRTLCVIVEEGRRPRVELSDYSTWHLFRGHRGEFATEREEWQLIAPFWSTKALQSVREGAKTTAHAFFRDAVQAKTVASAVVGPWLRCSVPRRKRPFHHKVVAWRGKSGRRVRVMLYVGSANLTPAGFLGLPPGKGYNWEAGVLFVGGEALWETAQQAVKANIDEWRQVEPKAGEPPFSSEVRPEGESDLQSRLEVHLGAAIRTSQRTIRRINIRPPADSTLCNVAVEIDEKPHRLPVGMSVSVPLKTRRVVVCGMYRTTGRVMHRVKIELPHLTTDPVALDLKDAVERFRRQLWGGTDERPPGGRPRKPPKSPEGTPSGCIAGDIRFPFRELSIRLAQNPASALAWLKQAATTRDQLPYFWCRTAERLLKVIP